MGRNGEQFLEEREIESYKQDIMDLMADVWERNVYTPEFRKNKHYARKMKKNRLKKTSRGQLYNPNLPF